MKWMITNLFLHLTWWMGFKKDVRSVYLDFRKEQNKKEKAMQLFLYVLLLVEKTNLRKEIYNNEVKAITSGAILGMLKDIFENITTETEPDKIKTNIENTFGVKIEKSPGGCKCTIINENKEVEGYGYLYTPKLMIGDSKKENKYRLDLMQICVNLYLQHKERTGEK